MTVAGMDDAARYLYEAGKCFEQMIDFGEIDSLLIEAGLPNAPVPAQQVEQNNAAAEQGEGFLHKAFDAIRNMIKSLMESLSNFTSYLFASKGEKAQYKDFVKQAQNDPELGNKKITYNSYKKQMELYEREIANAIDIEKAIDEGRPADIDGTISRLQGLIGSTAGAVTTSIALRTLEQIAKDDQGAAEKIRMFMQHNMGFLDRAESVLNKHRIKKFQKNIDVAAGKKGALSRLIVQAGRKWDHMRHEEDKSLGDSLAQVAGELKKDLAKPGPLKFTSQVVRDVATSGAAKDLMTSQDPAAKNIRALAGQGVDMYRAYAKGGELGLADKAREKLGLKTSVQKNAEKAEKLKEQEMEKNARTKNYLRFGRTR